MTGNDGVPREFDLTQLAENADRARRGRRRTVMTGGVIGVALVAIEAYFYFAPPPGAIPPHSFGPLLFILLGLVIFGYAWFVVLVLGPSARKLVVTSAHLSFESIPGRSSVRIEWNQPRFRLDIYDLRSRHAKGSDTPPRGYGFIVEPGGGPKTAVPLEARDLILQLACGDGMRMNQRTVPTGAG
ncbi:MAG: hypothetical protein ABSE66_09600 [Thermoplasmata archaeon]|jgi:hypothetical protein